MTASATPTHQDIQLPSGRRHHYVSVGAGGPRMVLLHGFTEFLA